MSVLRKASTTGAISPRTAAQERRAAGLGLSGPAVERSDRVAEQVYRNLRRAIILGEIEAGSRLREVEIAAALGVSRTPVREAISRLIGDRLVEELPSSGVQVSDTSAELYEIYCIREALETCAGRLAASRITEDQLARLDALVLAGESGPDLEQRGRINEEFHATIVEASGSPRLAEMIGGFREFFTNTRWLSRYDRDSAAQALEDHRQIAAALRARAPKQVEGLIEAHLTSAYAELLANKRAEPTAD